MKKPNAGDITEIIIHDMKIGNATYITACKIIKKVYGWHEASKKEMIEEIIRKLETKATSYIKIDPGITKVIRYCIKDVREVFYIKENKEEK